MSPLPWRDVNITFEHSPTPEMHHVALEHRPTGVVARALDWQHDTALTLAFEQLSSRVRT